MDYTHERPATRVHLSGDPQGGWIGEIHDGTNHFVHSPTDGSQPEAANQSNDPNAPPVGPTPAPNAESALDQLHAAYQSAHDRVIEGWDELKEAFLAKWSEIEQKTGQQRVPPGGQGAGAAAPGSSTPAPPRPLAQNAPQPQKTAPGSRAAAAHDQSRDTTQAEAAQENEAG